MNFSSRVDNLLVLIVSTLVLLVVLTWDRPRTETRQKVELREPPYENCLSPTEDMDVEDVPMLSDPALEEHLEEVVKRHMDLSSPSPYIRPGNGHWGYIFDCRPCRYLRADEDNDHNFLNGQFNYTITLFEQLPGFANWSLYVYPTRGWKEKGIPDAVPGCMGSLARWASREIGKTGTRLAHYDYCHRIFEEKECGILAFEDQTAPLGSSAWLSVMRIPPVNFTLEFRTLDEKKLTMDDWLAWRSPGVVKW